MHRVFGDYLCEIGERHPELVVLDADVSSSTQTALFGARYPQRFLNCGIAEANMVSVAAGMAAAGLRPVVSTFAFLLATRTLDQIRSQIAYGRLPVLLAGGYAGLSDAADGGSHQAIEDIACLSVMPNMTVVCPGDAHEVEQALEAALRQDGPVYLRLSRAEVARLACPEPFAIGRAIRRREGSDIALITTGQMLEATLEAADLLAQAGIAARVLDMHTVKPLDTEALLDAARTCRAIVTCEEHSILGGLGSVVAGVLAEHCPTPMRRVGVRDAFGQSGTYEELKTHYGLTPAHIAEAARGVLQRKGG